MGRTVRTENIVLWLCIALVAIAGLVPIVVMAVESVRHNGHLTLDHYRELISSARFWPLFGLPSHHHAPDVCVDFEC